MHEENMNRLLISLTLLFFLTACVGIQIQRPPVDTGPTPVSPSPTPTLTPVPLASGATPSPGPCAFNWATQALPELSEHLQTALENAGIGAASARAAAFGENCIEQDGDIQYFAVMETDYYLEVQVADIRDIQAAGERVKPVLQVLFDFPRDQVPGPRPGLVDLTLKAAQESSGVRFSIDQMEAALQKDLSGAELMEFLSQPSP